MHKKTALVTGATDKLGRAFVQLLASRGYNLILTGASEERLSELAHKTASDYRHFDLKVQAITKDLTRATNCDVLYAQLRLQKVNVDLLVNNSGITGHEIFSSADWPGLQRQIKLGITALTKMCHLFVKDMIRNGSGKILNVACTLQTTGTSSLTVNSGIKSYVFSFSRALRDEVRNHGIIVSALYPGVPAGNQNELRYGQQKAETEADFIAREGLRGLESGKAVIIPGLGNKFRFAASLLAPDKLADLLIRRITEKRQ